MKVRPKVPAFLVDAFVELWPDSAGGHGPRHLRLPRPDRAALCAHKGSGATGYPSTESDTWFDYYKAKTPPAGLEGVTTSKFEGPDQTKNYDSTFSVGAGISLATAQDSGKRSPRTLPAASAAGCDLSGGEGQHPRGAGRPYGRKSSLLRGAHHQFAIGGNGVRRQLSTAEKGGKQGVDSGPEGRNARSVLLSEFFGVVYQFRHGAESHHARVLSLFDATSYVMLSASGIWRGPASPSGSTRATPAAW